MSKAHLKLQHSESVVVHVAGQIYSAYIIAGRVTEGEEDGWMERSIREAMRIAVTTDRVVISDDEVSGD